MGGAKGQSVVSIFQGMVMTVTTIALTIDVMAAVNGSFGNLETAFRGLESTDSPTVLTPFANFGLAGLGSYLFLTGMSGNIGSNNAAQATKFGSSKSLHRSIIMTICFVGFWSISMPILGSICGTIFPDAASDSIIPYTAMSVFPPAFAGNIGAKKYQNLPREKKPEQALMKMRKGLQVCTNLRPVRLLPELKAFSSLQRIRYH